MEELESRARGRGTLPGPGQSQCRTCDVICEVCAEVCPNRANVAITVPGFADPRQIVHMDGLCNECGNCGTFCPHAGLPYKVCRTARFVSTWPGRKTYPQG